MGVFNGAGGIRSDVEDMLRFVSAEMELPLSPLSSAIKATQQRRAPAGGPTMDIGLGWHIDHAGDPILWHNGGTGGYRSYVGIDQTHRRGVVVLSNTANSVDDIGSRLLHPPRAHVAVPLKPDLADRYVGRYQLALDFVLTFTRRATTATSRPLAKVATRFSGVGHRFLPQGGRSANQLSPGTRWDRHGSDLASERRPASHPFALSLRLAMLKLTDEIAYPSLPRYPARDHPLHVAPHCYVRRTRPDRPSDIQTPVRCGAGKRPAGPSPPSATPR